MAGESLSFGGVAERYDRARPGYPDEAVRWLVGETQARVIELGAGTGKLSESLLTHDHLVLATDPDQRMLELLRRRCPEAQTVVAGAERIPAAHRSADVVVAAQAFHWFDLPVAVPEIARVLRPGGVLALVWNLRDESVPWVRRLGRLIGTQEQLSDPTEALAQFPAFGEIESRTFRHWQSLDRRSLLDLAASRSNLATMPDDERADRLEQIGALYDDYGRGPDGMQLPYLTRCYRAVLEHPPPPPPQTYVGEPTAAMDRSALPDDKPPRPAPRDPDDDVTLIDFR